MYESFFHLTGKPFELLPDPEFLYLSPVHRKAMTYLDYGIRERAGFILLTGEVGSGKTTIIKNIIKSLDANITTSKIFNTGVTSHQLLALINDDFGMETAGKDKVTLFKELYDFLIREFQAGHHCLILIDEAQNLTSDCLEEVRMLSNLETESSKLLQIILVGQPELRKILAATEMRQLRQRISVNCHITPLDREQTEAYILHRLERAGNRDAVTFSAAAFDLIQQQTRGTPRLINIMCDFLLLTAFVDESSELSVETVREVADDLQFERNYWNAAAAGSDNVTALPAAENVSARDEELILLKSELTARLDILEKRGGGFDQSDELAALADRCAALEESVGALRRLLSAGEPEQPVNQKQLPSLHPLLPRIPSPASPLAVQRQRKGFFTSLFGRS